MSRRNNAFYQSFRDIRTNRTVPIYSKVGQAQFLLREYVPRWNAPGEQLLACRFAGTIHEASGDWELRQLQHLLQYFQNTGFEKRHGYVDPAAAREIEKEIVLRNGVDDCGLGRDITPTVQLLAEMERGGPVFSQAERNLLLKCTFHTGDHSHGVPLIIDNTFPTPINCRPFEWGADIVTHSTTKYMDGHAVSVGGAVVDSGNFPWDKYADKFPGLTTPDESYHGLTYTKAFGHNAYITKATAQLMRDLGSIQSPQNAFLLNLGLETLHLRVPRHCENALTVAKWLEANPKVKWVNYSGLPSNKYYELSKKYLPNGSCGVIAFGLEGTREDAIKFMDRLKFIAIVTHVADARTCVLHPASHTHRQLTDEQLREAGVAPDLIRLSVGIEDVSDIIADIEQALGE